MTTKRYEFFDDGYWASNGCSCCEDDYMEAWNCNEIPYSTHSIGDSYVAAISHATQMSYDAEDCLLQLSLTELEELADVLDIDVVFVE